MLNVDECDVDKVWSKITVAVSSKGELYDSAKMCMLMYMHACMYVCICVCMCTCVQAKKEYIDRILSIITGNNIVTTGKWMLNVDVVWRKIRSPLFEI